MTVSKISKGNLIGFEPISTENQRIKKQMKSTKTIKPALRAGFTLSVIRIGFEPMTLSLEG